MKKIIITKNDANQRADKFLKKLLVNANINYIYKMFRNKDIKVNGKKINQNYLLQEGELLEMFLYEDKFQELTSTKSLPNLKITFDIVYEDSQILIVNKPAGLLVQGDNREKVNTLANQVLVYLHEKDVYTIDRNSTFTPGPVHRLDRNTSGLVIFGKTFEALQELNKIFKQHIQIEKTYLTICCGKLTSKEHLVGYIKKIPEESRVVFTRKDDPQSLMMETFVEPIKSKEDYSYVSVRIVTGRMHQIRIHLASINHPIIGDRKYGNFKVNQIIKAKYNLSYQLLHAYKIRFLNPGGCLSYLKNKQFSCQPNKEFMKIKNDIF